MQQYEVFRSHDIDQTRDLMSSVLCDHHLDVVDFAVPLDARMNSTRLRDVVLNYVEYGAPVLVDPGRTQRFLVVQAHINGRGVVWSGRDQSAAHTSRIVVSSPEESLRMSLSSDTRLVLVKIESATVERALRHLLDDEPDRPIRFDLGMDVAKGAPWLWYRTLLNEIGRVGRHDKPFAQSWTGRFEDWLVSRLLVLQHSNYSERLSRAAAHPARARAVVDATELVRAVPRPDWSPRALADALGVGLARLETGFRIYRGVSVAAFLLRERLRAVHRMLQVSDPAETCLDDVARSWGFPDRIGFVTEYTIVFGESPDRTLRC
ncbi:AraC family transcriptional regulator [Amycolatopsis endophytica]